MDDAGAVRLAEGLARLADDGVDLRQGERTSLEPRTEVFALEELHDDERRRPSAEIDHAVVEHLNDVRALDGGRSGRFSREARQGFLIAG